MGSALIWGIGLGALLTVVTGLSGYAYLCHLRRLVRAHIYFMRQIAKDTRQQANVHVKALTFREILTYANSNEAFAYIMEHGLTEEMLRAARDQGFDG